MYIGSLLPFVKIEHCHSMINVRVTLMYVILKMNQLNISSVSQILQRYEGELVC